MCTYINTGIHKLWMIEDRRLKANSASSMTVHDLNSKWLLKDCADTPIHLWPDQRFVNKMCA